MQEILANLLARLGRRLFGRRSQRRLGGGRLGANEHDRHVVFIEQTRFGEFDAVGVEQRWFFVRCFSHCFAGGLLVVGGTFLARGIGSAAEERKLHFSRDAVAWFASRTGGRFQNALVAGRATIEAAHAAKVVVDREVVAPEIVDLPGGIEGVENRQFEHFLSNKGK